MLSWLLLVLSLPTENATARMRAWRSLKTSGAAVLRDGVYVLPNEPAHLQTLQAVADDVRRHDGSAHLMQAQCEGTDLQPLFDRSTEFGTLLADMATARAHWAGQNPSEASKSVRKLRKAFDQCVAIDFFPGEAQKQTAAALVALEQDLHAALFPGEPQARQQAIARCEPQAFRGRTWATRARPWVDRLASAWLIRRHIDPDARFVWLKAEATCPKHAVGFDFDGATFSHVGARVTFETLLASFGLETSALLRLGLLVHSLDAGGVQPADAVGVEQVLAGMRLALADDDALMLAAAGVFEGLYQTYQAETQR